jgi:hypothetical protein
MRYLRYLIFMLGVFLIHTQASAEVKCVTSEGEAVIIGEDIPSAKAEAVSRAKWSALEQAVGVEVKAESVVQNFALVDDAVMKGVKGVIQEFKKIEDKTEGGIYWVRARVCVESKRAESAIMELALNNSILVFLPAKDPETGQYEESNTLSEAVISKLSEHGYQVVDVASKEEDAMTIERAMKTGNFITLRALLAKYMAGAMLIGKIDYTVSSKKGEDIGYGLSMPMNNVTVTLNYRLIAKTQSGQSSVLHTGSASSKGMALGVKDAQEKALQSLKEKIMPDVLNAMARHMKANTKKITLTIRGIKDLNENFSAKEAIQNTSWVTSTEERGLGEFIVGYPENIVYLLNSLSQRGFKINSFTEFSAVLEYNP